MTVDRLAVRTPIRLRAEPERVVLRMFVPGQYVDGYDGGRASGVVAHVLALSDDDVAAALHDVLQRFDGRHRDLVATFRQHADRFAHRLGPETVLSDERRLLLGATFSHEYAVEAAALCNPSAIVLPDQDGVPTGSVRFAISVRQIGEGHRSSIGFRQGTIDHRGGVTIDVPGPVTVAGEVGPSTLDARAFVELARRLDQHADATTWALDHLGPTFSPIELDAQLAELEDQGDTRRNVASTVRRLRAIAARSYTATFPPSSMLSERVLFPATAIEANGIEDARFVRFAEDDGSGTYYATYTAYDGTSIQQQLLSTNDFATFTTSPLLGAAAVNKGMALFPRRIGGRYAALTRHDGASNGIAISDELRYWPTLTPLVTPIPSWQVVQVGNCGSPIETDRGWLVLTHGVGPMRTYSIGALLLDLDEPTKVLASLPGPLLTPQPDEQDGYVPNVVYSCGGLLHGGSLVLPFGIGDSSIGIATVDVRSLLDAMR